MSRTTIPAVPQLNVKAIDKALKRELEANTLIEGYLAAFGGDTGAASCKGIGHCAIGALLFSAGFSNKKLMSGELAEADPKSQAARTLKRVYGILPMHTTAIEALNDSAEHFTQQQRYDGVMALVEFIAAMQDNGVRFSSYPSVGETYHTGRFSYEETKEVL